MRFDALKYLVPLFIILLLPLHALSQKYAVNERWRWTHFTVEDGLPSNAILSIIETHDGTPWVNTRSGLAWYNGYYWEKIDSAKGLPAQPLFVFTEDRNDSLLAIDDKHRLYYGGKHGFRSIRLTIDGKNVLVSAATKYLDERFLIVSNNILYITDKSRIEKYNLPKEFNDQKIFNVWNTDGKTIWLNTSAGLYRMENNRWHLKLPSSRTPYNVPSLRENVNGFGLAFIAGPPGDIGLWEWDPSSSPKKNPSEGFETVFALDVNNNNDRIILKETDLIKVKRNNIWSELTQINPEVKNILTVKYRNNGDLWVGTINGLYLFSTNSTKWTTLKFPSPDDRNKINEIISARDGSVWVATSGGILRYKSDGSIEKSETIEGRPLKVVTGIIEDNKGDIWISSGQSFDGAYKWDGTRWTHYGVKEGLDAGNVHKIRKDHKGRLWFLGLYRKDFHERNVDQEPGVFTLEGKIFSHWSKDHALPTARYYAFAEGTDGTLWFGSSVGLIRWKPDIQRGGNGTVKRWTVENGALLDDKIFTFAVDSNNILWFGDRSSGLGRVENDTVKYLTIADGLVSNDIWKLVFDSSARLWIGTQGGLGLYHNGMFSSFKYDEGLENIKIWPLLPLDDKIYIGTVGGGIQILSLAELDLTPPRFTALTSMIESGNAFIRWAVYSFWGNRPSYNIETRSRLDGGDWSAWSRQHGLRLSNMSAGDHKVSIQSKNILGEIDNSEFVIPFKIPAPFYSQAEFLIPVGALSTALIILSVVYITRKRRADAALRRSEQRYRNLFDNANDAIMIIDPEEKTILEANSKACEIYGYTKGEFISMPFSAVTRINDGSQDVSLWTLRESGSKRYETIHNTKSGRQLYMHINAALIDFEGKPAILTLHRDISDVRLAEAKIRLLAQTITSAKDYISITSLDNTILFVNDAFAEGHGYTTQELIGADFSVVLSPLTPREKVEEFSAKGIQGSWNGEIFHRRKDGTDFPAEVWSAVVQGEDNQPVAVVHVARDVTERKKSETERENLILELQNALLEVKTLSGLLPICSNCKKIRDDHGYWIQVETYISKHSEATFTHGLCPECLKQYYPEVYKRLKAKEERK
jgi:PAS domain S-box-containing protein